MVLLTIIDLFLKNEYYLTIKTAVYAVESLLTMRARVLGYVPKGKK